MPYLNIIRASAGSGKTYYLTGSFLELLLKEPVDYYRSMLAVTFTNKATEEMKNRLISELYFLATSKKSDYIGQLITATGFDEGFIRNKASAILSNILHGYSWFSIETIDTFFQRIIKAFARELAIPGAYEIETDIKPVLQGAIDRLVDNIHENKELLNWLVEFSEDRIAKGKSWNVLRELLPLGREIFKEQFAASSEMIYNAVSNRELLNKYKEHLYGLMGSFEKYLEELAKEALVVIENYGFEDSDFYQGSRGVSSYFRKLASRQVSKPNVYITKMLEGAEYWASSKSTSKAEVEEAASKYLLPLLFEISKSINHQFTKYNTAEEILKNIYSLGILADISGMVRSYLHEKNRFLLSDSPVFIYKIIDQNDTPFIYEKMGNRYSHFMIDEFQDTSVLQWQNFKPLISNSLSMGNDCLLVGDVKQSIYRWRNGNWEVLAEQVMNEFPKEIINQGLLDTNWRSGEYIIDFYNKIFPSCSALLQAQLISKIEGTISQEQQKLFNIDNLYQDVSQVIPSKSEKLGHVLIQFFEKDVTTENPDYYAGPLLQQVDGLLQNGYSPCEIAILVRSKKEGQAAADLLIEQNSLARFCRHLTVISDESLLLSASEGIQLIIAAMQYLLAPGNEVNRGKLAVSYLTIRSNIQQIRQFQDIDFEKDASSLKRLCALLPSRFVERINAYFSYPLYELAEQLIHVFELDKLENETPYIHSFLDLIHEFVIANSSDIGKFLEYWSDEGSGKSIPSSESQDALRILTIHKSKGLQFRAVIIPFCKWKLDQEPGTILWSSAMSDDFKYLPVIPVRYGKGLLDTEFSNTYLTELFKSYVDNLNLLYVSLTRAVETLIVFPVYRQPGKEKHVMNTVGDLMYKAIINSESEIFRKSFDPGKNTLEIGALINLEKPKQDVVDKEEAYIQTAEGSSATDRLFFDPSGFEYFRDSFENEKDPVIFGRMLHEILAQVNKDLDLDGAIRNAYFQGLISEEDGRKLMLHFNQCLKDPAIKKWFDGSGSVFTETDIILYSGEMRRPDRVVIYPDRVDIIDYKSGTEKVTEYHHAQVREYIQILRQMGYQNVNGYLWYINNNKVVEVND